MVHAKFRDLSRPKRFGYSRSLQVERLESRSLLAGDVDIIVSSRGPLLIRGDDAGNQVVILQFSSGAYAVVGCNGTLVEGSSDPFIVEGATGNFDVNLGKGNDLLLVGNELYTLIALAQSRFGSDLGDADALHERLASIFPEGYPPRRLEIARNFTVRTGVGDDGVVVAADIRGGLRVDLGNGDNALLVADSRIAGRLTTLAGHGNDELYLHRSRLDAALDAKLGNGQNVARVHDSLIVRAAVVTTGKHDDLIDFAGTGIYDGVTVKTGSGADEVFAYSWEGGDLLIVGNLDVDTGSGQDYVELVGVIEGIRINTGEHGDGVQLQNLHVEKNLVVNLGSGNDALAGSGVNVHGHASLDAGAGNDEISLLAVAVDKVLTALMGSGIDELEVFESTALRAILRGGSGMDTQNWDHPAFAPTVDRKEFEDLNLFEEEEVPEEVIVVQNPGAIFIYVVITTGGSSVSFDPP